MLESRASATAAAAAAVALLAEVGAGGATAVALPARRRALAVLVRHRGGPEARVPPLRRRALPPHFFGRRGGGMHAVALVSVAQLRARAAGCGSSAACQGAPSKPVRRPCFHPVDRSVTANHSPH